MFTRNAPGIKEGYLACMQVLEASGLRKEYGSLVAVNSVSFTVEQGQVLGMIGPNGAGKTTLLRMLATVLRPTSGQAKILGYDSAREYLQIRKHLGYLPDFFNLYNDLTIRECLEFFAKAYNVDEGQIPAKIDEALKLIELEDKRNDFVRHLSRGMVQRMGLGVILVHEPDVLLLDEPASGLDPRARIQLRQVLKKLAGQGKTIIISSHILTELSDFCTHIAIMNKGNIVLHGLVEQIQRRVFNIRQITVSVADDVDNAASAIRAFPGAGAVKVEEKRITADIDADDNKLAELNSYLVSKGIRVCGLWEEKADLEDLFMELSGKDQMPLPVAEAGNA
jgi:ABC-2 type transport system ATP-binding protein